MNKGGSKVLNTLIGVSLVMNIGFMCYRFVKLYKESKDGKKKCKCQDKT